MIIRSKGAPRSRKTAIQIQQITAVPGTLFVARKMTVKIVSVGINAVLFLRMSQVAAHPVQNERHDIFRCDAYENFCATRSVFAWPREIFVIDRITEADCVCENCRKCGI